MKSFLALCLFASVLKARADVNVGVATVSQQKKPIQIKDLNILGRILERILKGL